MSSDSVKKARLTIAVSHLQNVSAAAKATQDKAMQQQVPGWLEESYTQMVAAVGFNGIVALAHHIVLKDLHCGLDIPMVQDPRGRKEFLDEVTKAKMLETKQDRDKWQAVAEAFMEVRDCLTCGAYVQEGYVCPSCGGNNHSDV